MQAGVTHFADSIQPVDIRAAKVINHYTAAGIVRGRDDRDRLFGQIDTQSQQFFINHREMLTNKCFRFMADVEEHAVSAQTFHLVVNGTGDNIARSQFATLVKIGHEARAVRALQVCAFATQRLGQQEIARLRMIQRRGVKLVKFKIGDTTSRAPGHCNPIPRGDIRIGGVLIHF